MKNPIEIPFDESRFLTVAGSRKSLLVTGSRSLPVDGRHGICNNLDIPIDGNGDGVDIPPPCSDLGIRRIAAAESFAAKGELQ